MIFVLALCRVEALLFLTLRSVRFVISCLLVIPRVPVPEVYDVR